MPPIDHKRLLGVFLAASCLLILGIVTGCAQLDLPEKLSWSDKPPKPRVPISMTDMWTDTIRYTQSDAPKRGFGGRIMFCDKAGGKPVAVDGRLTVYAFDEAHKDMKHLAPLRKFVFPAENLSKHYSKSDMGHSYSFWLPWDKVGGPEQRLALVAKFEPIKGGAIMSKESNHVLPGMPVEEAQKVGGKSGDEQDPGVRQVSYEAPAAPKPKPRSLGPSTFNLPPGLTRQLRRSPPSQDLVAPESMTDQSERDSLLAPPPEAGRTYRQDPNGALVPPSATSYYPAWEARGRRGYGREPSMAAVPSTHSSRSRFPAQTSTTFRSGSSPERNPQHRSGWPSSPPTSPQSSWSDQ